MVRQLDHVEVPDTARQLMDQLAFELRQLRKRAGKSLRELERTTYASDSALSRYLAGRNLPPWRVVAALSVEGGRDPEELRDLWERASKAHSRSKVAEPVAPQEPAQVRMRSRVPVRWLVALALAVGVVGVLVTRRRSASGR